MYKNKKVGIIGIIITIMVLILLVIVTTVDISKFSKADNILSKLIMPIQNGLTYLKNKISGNDIFFRDIDNLRAENKKLIVENRELEEKLKELEIIRAENTTLRAYNNMSEKYRDYKTIPAYIINKDVSNLSNTMVINVGKDNGIDVNMPVITTEGLVGHIISVTNKTSKVKPIIDPSSNVSAAISTSRDSVIVKGIVGSSNTLKLIFIATNIDLMLDDIIETSGIGGIYPKGILIGKISQIIKAKNITDRYAVVETAVDFSKLETVLVITE